MSDEKLYKEALISWWICVLLTFFLWYRNRLFDRYICFIILIIGIINLLIYAVESGADRKLVAELIFIAIMLTPLVLAIGVFLYSDKSHLATISFINIILSLVALLLALMLVFSSSCSFDTIYQSEHLTFTRNGESLLGLYGYIFVFCFVLGFILLLNATDFNSIGLYLVLGFICAVLIYAMFTPVYWMSALPYIGPALAFLIWFAPLINI